MTTTMKKLRPGVDYAIRADLRMGPNGQLVIPEALCREVGLEEGADVVACVEDDGLVLITRERLVASIRGHFAHIPKDVSLVDELIAERREAADREAEEEHRAQEPDR